MKVIPPLALLFSLAALAISLIRQPEPSLEKSSPSTARLETRIRSLENELAQLANATRQPVNEFKILSPTNLTPIYHSIQKIVLQPNSNNNSVTSVFSSTSGNKKQS
jgi:hypothetical protein